MLNGPRFYGCDYNRRLVNWCKETLSFADVSLNGQASKLDFDDNKFSFIYAISVFTHLREEVQNFWIKELTRVLSPGGYFLMTVHGTTRLPELSSLERQRFEDGQLVLREEAYSGANICGSYHPEKYVREKLCKDLTVVDFVPGGAKDANQDAFLLRKPD
jgi:ubiquinone/menaquinone biosynthesis C-methylase UbiE